MVANPKDVDPAELTCPSAPPEPGSVILGVVVGPSQLAYLSPHVPVTDALLAGLQANNTPVENRMRFAGPCFGERCMQWADGRCGLIDRIAADPGARVPLTDLPRCGIRATCRWYAQHQRAACEACPNVMRKPSGTD
jgi:hypothetical protein